MPPLRTLVIAAELPYPAFYGRDLRNWQNLRALAQLGDVGVFGVISNQAHRSKLPPLELAFWRASRDPSFNQSPTRTRYEAQAWPLDPRGHPADANYTESVAGEIVEILNTFKPGWVIVEGLTLYRYIELLKHHGCRVVIDSHNVEAVLARQIAQTIQGKELPQRLARDVLPLRTKIIEEIAVQTADQVWVCSDADQRTMRDQYPGAKPIHVVPNTIDVESYAEARAERTSGRLIFPGHFGHAPNAAAASFVIGEILPRLTNSLGDWKMVFAGLNPTSEMLEAAQREPRIIVTGGVPDMPPYLANASTMIVPLFQGSGTRFKLLEAFASKLPVISTALGAEGLAAQHEKHLLLAESADEFAAAITRLWSDADLGRRLAGNGLALVNNNYSPAVATERIADALGSLSQCHA